MVADLELCNAGPNVPMQHTGEAPTHIANHDTTTTAVGKLEKLGVHKASVSKKEQEATQGVQLPGPTVRPVSPCSLELADSELGDRFSECSDSLNFFVEFRFTEPSLCQAIATMQRTLVDLDPSLVVDQSCASDNLHITMNELCLGGVADVHRAVKVLEACVEPCLQSQLLELTGTRTLGGRVFCAKLAQNDAAARLCDIHRLCRHALHAAGFEPLERAEFTPHMTVCKARGNKLSDEVREALSTHGFDVMQFGTQPFLELCFCCKRRRDEAVPPVVRRLLVG